MERRYSLRLTPNVEKPDLNIQSKHRQTHEHKPQTPFLCSNTSIREVEETKGQEKTEEQALALELEKKLKVGRSSSTLQSQRQLLVDNIKQIWDGDDSECMQVQKLSEGSSKMVEEQFQKKQGQYGQKILENSSFRDMLSHLIMEI